MPLIWRGVSQQVEADWMFCVGGVEICHILNPPPGNAVKEFIRQIAMRVNDCDAVAGFNVLEDQIAEQGRFARSAFSNGV